jgi:acyl-CoA thioesterase-1
LARASASPRSSSGSITFSSAFRCASSWKDWNTKPSLALRRLARPSSSSAKMSTPSRITVPRTGVSRPASRPSSVDLPEPEAPTMASVSAGCTVKSTLCRIVSSPLASATRLLRPHFDRGRRYAGMTTQVILEASGMSRMLVILKMALGAGMLLASASAYSAPKTVLVLGDSLSAEYGLARGAGWVALLEQKLKNEKIDAAIVNASISGETTSGGRTGCRRCSRSTSPTWW